MRSEIRIIKNEWAGFPGEWRMAPDDMSAAKNELHQIAAQAYSLAMGLQNAAPTQGDGPPKSVQYLLEISLQLEKFSKAVEGLALVETTKRR